MTHTERAYNSGRSIADSILRDACHEFYNTLSWKGTPAADQDVDAFRAGLLAALEEIAITSRRTAPQE